ncbi:MAG: hydrogenase nickel incorporation protein HypB [Nitrospirae bacterium]|nr:hydrogenase nickel incorporation protein HypB [Magnetococcales bacterium]HAT50044.1 hydrogenase accessory protein HypB [Alphaproteobacteria bacterium]
MCETCGCTPALSANTQTVEVLSAVFAANDRAAAHNRLHLGSHGVLAVNLMSSPGAGKTALLEAVIDTLGKKYRLGVIEGDLETENDAQRIRAKGIPAIQINTGSACHLDASLIHTAMHQLNLDTIDILFIENIGNLVCPAVYDLGQEANVILLSVTEGDDKPAKYPVMFRVADLLLVSKTDLLPYLDDFKVDRAENCLRKLANRAPIIPISVRSGQGMDDWLHWLEQRYQAFRKSCSQTNLPHDHHHP